MDTDMFGSNQCPPMPRFAATYLSFFAAKSVCIGVHPWLKPGSVAAPLLQEERVLFAFRSYKCGESEMIFLRIRR
jgi:hypothetical protein